MMLTQQSVIDKRASLEIPLDGGRERIDVPLQLALARPRTSAKRSAAGAPSRTRCSRRDSSGRTNGGRPHRPARSWRHSCNSRRLNSRAPDFCKAAPYTRGSGRTRESSCARPYTRRLSAGSRKGSERPLERGAEREQCAIAARRAVELQCDRQAAGASSPRAAPGPVRRPCCRARCCARRPPRTAPHDPGFAAWFPRR